MASVVGNDVLDNGLNEITTKADTIWLVSQDPTTFTEATSTYALGSHNFGKGAAFGAPAAGSPNGRAVTSNAIASGSVTATGTATGWAVVDTTDSILQANGQLAASQAVTSGNTFTLTAFPITLPNQ